MTDDFAVKVQGLSKRFKLYASPWSRAAEWLSFGHLRKHFDFWALREITLQVKQGECLGIIGPNGAGKSTLLKILSRSMYPTEGSFYVKGLTVSLLELGTGFHPQLSGIENIFNSARLLGFSEEMVRSHLGAILEFAELGDFINRPVYIYSSGMYVRLAFSLFAFLEPDVYIIDEALAVGDSSFQKKCVDRINEMRQNGVTILFVSHDLWRVEALCDRALYLDHGRVQLCDSAPMAVKRYVAEMERRSTRQSTDNHEDLNATEPIQRELNPQFEMYSNSPLRIRKLLIRDTQGLVRNRFSLKESFEVSLEYSCETKIKQPVFRVVFALPDERRVAVIGWQPGDEKYLDPGPGLIRWRVRGGTLYARRYVLHTSVSTWDGVVYDTHYGAANLEICANESGNIHRTTDDLAAYLDYAVQHEA